MIVDSTKIYSKPKNIIKLLLDDDCNLISKNRKNRLLYRNLELKPWNIKILWINKNIEDLKEI
jgi:hypothetical protein